MRLAISNIAWDVAEDEDVAALLRRYDIDAIDVAPPKYFSKPTLATAMDIRRVREWWSTRGCEITGMQSLLFGTTGFNIFGTEAIRSAMLQHLDSVCRIGGGLGATRLVFGSPKNRDRSGCDNEQTRTAAVSFFRRLGDLAVRHGVTICLEPNPARYGANFMMDSAETADVVRAVCHPAIRMQLDIGALTVNQEDPATVLEDCADLIGHIHASEPDLVPLGDASTDHCAVHEIIAARLASQVVCIEMVATKEEPHLVAIERAVALAVEAYRSPVRGTVR